MPAVEAIAVKLCGVFQCEGDYSIYSCIRQKTPCKYFLAESVSKVITVSTCLNGRKQPLSSSTF